MKTIFSINLENERILLFEKNASNKYNVNIGQSATNKNHILFSHRNKRVALAGLNANLDAF